MYNTNLAIVSYTPPMTAMEFVRSEVVRGVESGMIPDEQIKLRKGTNSYNSFKTFYGSAGYETFKKMEAVLRASSLKIRYSRLTKKFTILNSSAINTDEIRSIFARRTYEDWLPKVLDEVDKSGNRLVRLTCEVSPSLHPESHINDIRWLCRTDASEKSEILSDQLKRIFEEILKEFGYSDNQVSGIQI